MKAASIINPARKMAYAMSCPLNPSVTRSQCQGRLRAFLAEGRSSLRLKTATAFGSRDYALRFALRCFPTPLLRRGSGAYGCTCGHKLSLTATLPLRPTPSAAPAESSQLQFRLQPSVYACLSEPSLTGCFPPSSFHAHAILTAIFHPPFKEEAACIQSQRPKPPVNRLRRYAHPRPRCTAMTRHELHSDSRPTTPLTPS